MLAHDILLKYLRLFKRVSFVAFFLPHPSTPRYRDSWESVVELQSQRARQQGQAEFENFISNTDNLSMPVDHAQLQQICATAKKLAFSAFDSICVAPNSRLRNLLKQHIHDRTHALREQNLEVSRSLAHLDALAEWNQMKLQHTTCISALEAVIALSSSVSLSDHGPGVWEGLGHCTADVILPEVIAIARKFDFENSQARALERDALLSDLSASQMQCREAAHKAERLESANSELQQQRACLIAEKAAIEESLTTVKGDLESKSRELQSLQVSSDSAKETLLQQLDVSFQKNTSYAAQVHMLETDVRAGVERQSGLQASIQQLHDDFHEREIQLVAQVDASSSALEMASKEREQARSREEDLRVECAVLKERLQNASEAAAADLVSSQQQLETTRGKVQDLSASRDLLEAALSQREQEHSEAIRLLMIESSQKESALESKIFQQAQSKAGFRQQLQEAHANSLELERKLRESDTANQQLMHQFMTLSQAHASTQAQLESVQHAHDELKAQSSGKMQHLLQESTLNQQQLHELQLSLQMEQSRGQDAILAGTEVLQELARLKLQMYGSCYLLYMSLRCSSLIICSFCREDEAHDKKVASAKTGKPKSSLPLFARYLVCIYQLSRYLTPAIIRRDSLKFQPMSLPQAPQ